MHAWEVIRSDSNGGTKPQALGLFATKELAVDWMDGHPNIQTEVIEREFPDVPKSDPTPCSECGGQYVRVHEALEHHAAIAHNLWACENCGHRWVS